MVEGLHGVADSGSIEAVQHGLHLPPAHHAGTGDHQNIVDILLLQKAAQLLDLAGALQVLGHPVAHKVVAHFQNALKGTAPNDFQFVGH